MTVDRTVVKAGRSYKVTQNGSGDANVKYQVILTSPLAANELPMSFPGVPQIGTEHPDYKGLYVLDYDVTQPEGPAKSTLEVVVHYGRSDITETPGDPSADPPTADKIEAVTEWGWDDGTGEKELVSTVETSPKAVVNSAGDPFDSVPMVSVPTPTFTKVIRTSERKAYAEYLCTVNNAAITIGAMSCPAGTLLCTVAEKKLIGEWRMPYEYTIRLRYRSNIVPDRETGVETEVGWNAAVVDAGMREIDTSTGELKLIQVISKETGQPATVTAPELLDGHGHAVTRTSSGVAQAIVLVFPAYKQKAFPNWFYSEPPTPPKPADAPPVPRPDDSDSD